MINDENYIHIAGWMINKLDLKGSELLIYAIIYGFSQDGESMFTASSQYLADWTNTTKQSVFKVLKSLTERELIIRKETNKNNITFVSYRYNDSIPGVPSKSLEPIKKVDRVEEKDDMGNQKSLSNNKYINKYNNIDRKEYISKDIYKKSSKFVKPTLEEIKEYCSQMNYKVDAEKFYLYYEQCGWTVGKNKPMKDWRASLRLWNMNQAQYQERKEQSKVASLNFSNEECEKQLKDEVIPF